MVKYFIKLIKPTTFEVKIVISGEVEVVVVAVVVVVVVVVEDVEITGGGVELLFPLRQRFSWRRRSKSIPLLDGTRESKIAAVTHPQVGNRYKN